MLLVGGDRDGTIVELRGAPDFVKVPKLLSFGDRPPPDEPVPEIVDSREAFIQYTRRSINTPTNTYWFMAPEDWTDDMAFSHLFDR